MPVPPSFLNSFKRVKGAGGVVACLCLMFWTLVMIFFMQRNESDMIPLGFPAVLLQKKKIILFFFKKKKFYFPVAVL